MNKKQRIYRNEHIFQFTDAKRNAADRLPYLHTEAQPNGEK